MTGFRQAAARFSAEVEWALTRARRAARDARAESTEFRRRTEELTTQAKTKRLRRTQATPTSPEARAEAAKFRADNGLPVPDLPAAEELAGRPPARRAPENDDLSQLTVLFDVDKEPTPLPPPAEPVAPAPEPTRSSDREDDFSHQRILMDATVETYRPDEILGSVFDTDEPGNRR